MTTATIPAAREQLLRGHSRRRERRLELAGISTPVLEGGSGSADGAPARPGRARSQMAGGDPQAGREPPGDRPGPARAWSFGGGRRSAHGRAGAPVDGRADRSDLLVAARAGGTSGGRRHRHAVRRFGRAGSGPPGAGGHARPGAVSARAGVRRARCTRSLPTRTRRPSTRSGPLRLRYRSAARPDGRAVGLRSRATPSSGPARPGCRPLRLLLEQFGFAPIPPDELAGSRCRRRSSGGGTISRPVWRWPRRRVPAMDGRCT